MAKNQGKDFEDRFKRRLVRVPGVHVERFRDSHSGLFDRPAAEGEGAEPSADGDGNTAARFSPPNKYDFLIMWRVTGGEPRKLEFWHVYAAECKSTISDRFTFSMVTKVQRDGLLGMPPGAPALVVVEMRKFRRCFSMPIRRLLWREKFKKSMNLDDLFRYATELPMNTQGRETLVYYDPMPLLLGASPTWRPTEPLEVSLPLWVE